MMMLPALRCAGGVPFMTAADSVLTAAGDSLAATLPEGVDSDSPADTSATPAFRFRSELRQQRRDSIRANKKVWISVLGGPSYTPEASLGVGGAMLASFKMNRADTVSLRSFVPVGFNISLNGTIVVAGSGTLYMKENHFRVYLKYEFRNEPAHYYGKGYNSIESVHRSDTTTRFKKTSFLVFPRVVWELKPGFFLGPIAEISYASSRDINPVMAADPYFNAFKPKYLNVGLGGIIQYDTRDDISTPTRGMLVSGTGKVFSHILGSRYDYQMVDLEYRQFAKVFRPRSVLAWTARTQIGFGDVPFTELPMFGTPNDLRGYYWGQYRDKSMAYAIAEYRHMFGSEEAYRLGRFYSKLGFVVWGGAGSIGDTPAEWTKWKFNYGAGIRIQVQPHKNFRFDVGKAPGTKGLLFYMNMTEAF